MADLLIHPGRLSGHIVPPPSKSDAHRALIAAALAGSLDQVSGLPEPWSDDIKTTLQCLEQLMQTPEKDQPVILDCAESGSTLRFMIPLAAALGRPARFTGRGRLPHRPISAYRETLSSHGIKLDFPDDPAYSLPLAIQGQLQSGVFSVPGHISSQYISGLLFALPILPGDSVIQLTTPLASAPYVDMTLATLAHYGIVVHKQSDRIHVPGHQVYRPQAYQVERDYSQAAFWLTAAYTGSRISVEGLNPRSLQGDREICRLLQDFSTGKPDYTLDAAQIPDLVPILAVAAACTPTQTRIIRAERLRLKESDRLQAICHNLRAIGADIEETDDGLLIQGRDYRSETRPLEGGEADGFGDHRIVMALAIAALSTHTGILIRGAEAVNKSYPTFFREFRELGGKIDGINMGEPTENQFIW